MYTFVTLIAAVGAFGVGSSAGSSGVNAQTPSPIAQEEQRIIENTTKLLRQYNADVVQGRPVALPLLVLLRSLATLVGQPEPAPQTAGNSTANQRINTEYEVLTRVNQEITQITRSLKHS